MVVEFVMGYWVIFLGDLSLADVLGQPEDEGPADTGHFFDDVFVIQLQREGEAVQEPLGRMEVRL